MKFLQICRLGTILAHTHTHTHTHINSPNSQKKFCPDFSSLSRAGIGAYSTAIVMMLIFFSIIPAFAQEAGSKLPVETELPSGSAPPVEIGFLAAPAQRGDFWVCTGAETAFYSYSGVSAGASLAVAYGSKFSTGFKAAWFFDTKNELDALELNFLLRYYFMGGAPWAWVKPAERSPSAGGAPSAGPYLQLTGGPAFFFDKEEGVTMPAHWGRVSAGATFGWRFLFGKLFFVEPYIRAGYPYIAGAGVSGGIQF